MSVRQLVMGQQPLWTGSMACYDYSPDIVRKFTVWSAFEEQVVLYRAVGSKILVPRAVCPLGQQDLRSVGLPVKFDKLNFTPRTERQAKAVAQASELLADGANFIFRAPTGDGKTAMSMPIIAGVGRLTLIVVTKVDLIERWREDLQKILGLLPNEIGLVRQDTVSIAGKKVVIAMVHTLVKDGRVPSWAKQQIGFVIFDEVHRMGAEEFSKACSMFPAKLRMGLSATPRRRDGKDVVFESHIGPVSVVIDKAALLPKVLRLITGWNCPRNKVGDKVPHAAGKDMHIKKALARSAVRNQRLCAAICKIYNAGRQQVVFIDLVDHAKTLEIALHGLGVNPGDIGMYMGSLTAAQEAAAKKKRIIFATWGKMGEGTSVDTIDTIVLAGPRSDVEQPIGRALRIMDGKKQVIVVDLVDDDSPVFKGYARRRFEWYQKIGAEVSAVSV